MMPPGADNLLDELLSVLDAEAELLERKRSQLADLSDALVRRDDDATENLLGRIEQAGREQESVDANLGSLRRALAGRFTNSSRTRRRSWPSCCRETLRCRSSGHCSKIRRASTVPA